MRRKTARDATCSSSNGRTELIVVAILVASVCYSICARHANAQQFQFGLLQTTSQQQANAAQQQQNPTLKQYSSRTSSSSLVNAKSPQQAQQLRRQSDISATTNLLDNVIESTSAATQLVAAAAALAADDELEVVPQQSQISSAQNTNNKAYLYTPNPKPAATGGAGCQLPPTWAGRWYQANGREPIRVTNTEISDKGICRDQKGDKYLFETTQTTTTTAQNSQAKHNKCLVCLVINERHLNVLQYKESSCQPAPSNYIHGNNSTNNNNNYFGLSNTEEDHKLLDSICNEITGDAQLESLFRLDTPNIECPISGKYTFTYDTCHEAQSSLDSCIDKKQLNFKYAACPDVAGSESKCK